MNVFPIIEQGAHRAIKNQEIKDCDFYDDEGFLVCGICKERRQEIKEFSNPCPENPKNKTSLKVTRSCKCDRERTTKDKEDKYIKYLKETSGIDKKYESVTFSSCSLNKFNEKPLKLCKRYALSFDKMLSNNQGLLLWGDVGTGKTHAAVCIADYLISQKIPVLMTSLHKIISEIEAREEPENVIISRLEKAKLVIFDDLGTERDTAYALEKVYRIIDNRNSSGLPMIFTTNLSLKDMQDEEDLRYVRIYERILEVCYPIQFTGPSWRKREAVGRFKEMERLLNED